MVDWPRVLGAVGWLFVVGAIARSIILLSGGSTPLKLSIELLLLGATGGAFLYAARWLPQSDVDPDLYPRVIAWCLGGVGVMAVVLGLRVLHPGVTVEFAFGSRVISFAIGAIVGLGIGIQDVRSITRTRRVLQQRNRELNDLTSELEHAVKQLEDSNERLSNSNEQLDHFASIASHDLQEPLRMISRYLELLEYRYADELDEDAREFIHFAVDGADRMKVMVDGLLQYSRLGTRMAPLEPTDTSALLETIHNDLQVRIAETGASIAVDPLPTVIADREQLSQLFRNLLLNALKYRGDEPPRIHVGAERVDDTWQFSVTDNGIGIDPADHDRIFDLFDRLHTPDEHDGSGIGLALCRRIAERHGGEIWVESEHGSGATFYVTLPHRGTIPEGFDSIVVLEAM